MSDAAMRELQMMRKEFAMLVASLSPWISIDEMCVRYSCVPKTLNNMERDGRLPFRKNGKWSRNEIREFEAKIP